MWFKKDKKLPINIRFDEDKYLKLLKTCFNQSIMAAKEFEEGSDAHTIARMPAVLSKWATDKTILEKLRGLGIVVIYDIFSKKFIINHFSIDSRSQENSVRYHKYFACVDSFFNKSDYYTYLKEITLNEVFISFGW